MNNFIDKAKKIHGNKYNYDKTIYIKSSEKVIITCIEHGDFKVTPNNHLSKKTGCPECKKNTKSNYKKFLSKSNYNNITYYEENYINNRTKMYMECDIHGGFKQNPDNHIKIGCPYCSKDKLKKSNAQNFIDKANKVHNNKYDYSQVDYSNNYTEININCKKHGIFKQQPKVHLKGHGCPICSESKGEKEVKNILKKYNIKYKREFRFSDCVNKYTLPFDFYLPEYNICVEFNGRQHYEPISLWGDKNYLNKVKKNDKIKRDYCLNKGIKLCVIKYNQIKNIEKILCEILKL
jgi:hypothetical protein